MLSLGGLFPSRNFKDHPVQWFSNLSLHQNCPKDVLKLRLLGSTHPKALMSRSRWGLRVCVPSKFPVVLMLLVWGPRFEDCCASVNADFGDENPEVPNVCSLPCSSESGPPSSWCRPRSGQESTLPGTREGQYAGSQSPGKGPGMRGVSLMESKAHYSRKGTGLGVGLSHAA